MQAVILAAGKGSRIYPFSLERPKPLIEVANKPILEHNLDQLLGIVDEVILIVGYKHDQIMEYFGDSYHTIKIRYVVQEVPMGTGHAVSLAENFVKDNFIVMNGDDLFSRKDILEVIKYENCILLQEVEDVSSFGVVEVNEGLVTNFIEKPPHSFQKISSNLVNTGMYCFTPYVFPIIKLLKKSERGEYEITDAVKHIAQVGKMNYHVVQGFWLPVGYPWHILDANQILLSDEQFGSIRGTIEEGVIIEGSVDIGKGSVIKKGSILRGNIVIGENALIGEGTILVGHTAIGKNSIVGNESLIENSIIGCYSMIGEKCELKDSVFGDNVRMHDGVSVSNKPVSGTVKIITNTCEFDSKKEKLGAFVADNCVVRNSLKSGECVSKDF